MSLANELVDRPIGAVGLIEREAARVVLEQRCIAHHVARRHPEAQHYRGDGLADDGLEVPRPLRREPGTAYHAAAPIADQLVVVAVRVDVETDAALERRRCRTAALDPDPHDQRRGFGDRGVVVTRTVGLWARPGATVEDATVGVAPAGVAVAGVAAAGPAGRARISLHAGSAGGHREHKTDRVLPHSRLLFIDNHQLRELRIANVERSRVTG